MSRPAKIKERLAWCTRLDRIATASLFIPYKEKSTQAYESSRLAR